MDSPRNQATALILAGGGSTRMGRPKPWLPFMGEPLLARVTGCFDSLVSEVLVVSAPGVPLPPLAATVRVVEDDRPGLGPLAGIVYGLRQARFANVFVCGGDHPFPAAALVTHLLSRTSTTEWIVPRWGGRSQPLFSACRRSVLAKLETRLTAGKRGLVAAAKELHAEELPPEEAARLDPEGRSFLDLDDPADYQRALDLARA